MHEMQLQGSEGDGHFTQLQNHQTYQPWYSSFGPEAACRRESGCCAPYPSSSPHPLARLAHLRRILRCLRNLPKAMRGEVTDASSACPHLPPLPPGLLRPLAVGLPPRNAPLGDDRALSLQPTVQQMEPKRSVTPLGSRGVGRFAEEGAVAEDEGEGAAGEEERAEEKYDEDGTWRQRRLGDDAEDEGQLPSGVSSALYKVSWPT